MPIRQNNDNRYVHARDLLDLPGSSFESWEEGESDLPVDRKGPVAVGVNGLIKGGKEGCLPSTLFAPLIRHVSFCSHDSRAVDFWRYGISLNQTGIRTVRKVRFRGHCYAGYSLKFINIIH